MSQQLSTKGGNPLTAPQVVYFSNGLSFNAGTDVLTDYAYTDAAPGLVLRGTGTWTTAPTYSKNDLHTDHIGRTCNIGCRLVLVAPAPAATAGTDTVHIPLSIAPQDSDEEFFSYTSTAVTKGGNEVLFAKSNATNTELDLYKVNVNTGVLSQVTASMLQLGTLNFHGVYHDDGS